jgi:hypothetical protein
VRAGVRACTYAIALVDCVIVIMSGMRDIRARTVRMFRARATVTVATGGDAVTDASRTFNSHFRKRQPFAEERPAYPDSLLMPPAWMAMPTLSKYSPAWITCQQAQVLQHWQHQYLLHVDNSGCLDRARCTNCRDREDAPR